MSQFPDAKALFSAIATLLTFVAFVPYYLSIWNRRVRPHVFSWFIWGGGTMIVFFAQLAGGGGIGAWPAVVSALLTLGWAASPCGGRPISPSSGLILSS